MYRLGTVMPLLFGFHSTVHLYRSSMVASGSMMVRFSPLKMGLFGSILYYIIYKKYDRGFVVRTLGVWASRCGGQDFSRIK